MADIPRDNQGVPIAVWTWYGRNAHLLCQQKDCDLNTWLSNHTVNQVIVCCARADGVKWEDLPEKYREFREAKPHAE